MCRSFLLLSSLYNWQIDSMLPCVCSIIDHRRRQNVVKISVTLSPAARMPLLCFHHIWRHPSDVRCSMFNVRCLTPDFRCPMPAMMSYVFLCVMSVVWFLMSDFQCSMSDIWCPMSVSDVRCLISFDWCLMSDIWCLISENLGKNRWHLWK